MPYIPSLSFSAYELPIERGAITIKFKLNIANSNTANAFLLYYNKYMSIYIELNISEFVYQNNCIIFWTIMQYLYYAEIAYNL
jgi:hypothetical protein